MSDWTRKLFIEHSELFLKLLDQRWPRTEELVNGMKKVLDDSGIRSGTVLDLCCGNGRISVHMAKKGFRAVGVDISRAFLENAERKAEEHKVSNLASFIEGDVRDLRNLLADISQPFDVVVNAWTSIGYFSKENDFSVFRQARELSRKGSILFIAETMHSEFISLKFTPTSYMKMNNIVMLEDRKYDPGTSQMNACWTFYHKRGENLEFIDRIEYDLHIYSTSELTTLLKEAGWEAIAFYGNLSTLQPMNPLASLNIVAKAQ